MINKKAKFPKASLLHYLIYGSVCRL